MFRKNILFVDHQGTVILIATIGELRATCVDILSEHLETIDESIAAHTAVLNELEFNLMNTFGYPNLEATRHGMRCYVDGTIQRQIDSVNASLAESQIRLEKLLPDYKPAPAKSAQETAQSNELFAEMMRAAKSYVKMADAGQRLKRQAKILRAIINEVDEALMSQAPAVFKKI